MSEEELVEMLKKKDMKALDELIEQYGRLILGVSRSILNEGPSSSFIDECYNDVVLILWSNISKFELQKGTFKNWIISLTKYKAIDYKRKANKRYEVEDIDNTKLSDKEDIEQRILDKEEKLNLEKVINKLDDIDKEIFTMRFIKDKSISEISKELNISSNVIYTRISRGKNKLRKLMEVYYE